MIVSELIKALQKASDQGADVRITDTHGSAVDEIFTVEESPSDGEVLLIVQGVGL
jgi:hypothetical protein